MSTSVVTAAICASWWTVDHRAGVDAELHYTEAGVCEMPAQVMRGRTEIAKGYASRVAAGPRLSRHLVSNLMFEEISESSVRATYALTLYAGDGVAPLGLTSPSVICDVVDELTVVGDQWLISRRRLQEVFVAADYGSVFLDSQSRQ